MSNSHPFRIAIACLVAAPLAFGFAASAHAADVTGAGASFIYPVMAKWSSDYDKPGRPRGTATQRYTLMVDLRSVLIEFEKAVR